jgi:LemA protein
MSWIVPGSLLLLVLLYAVALYNGLVQRRNRVRNAWAQIDVQLLRRSDLIPDLVESVKGYMRHETAIFDRIVQARQQALAAGSDVPARSAAEAALGQQMRGLLALAEAVPELRASDNMKGFQEELATTENRIAFARQFFNDAVLDYNNRLQTVPSNLIANSFAFTPEAFFEAEPEARKKPVVAF